VTPLPAIRRFLRNTPVDAREVADVLKQKGYKVLVQDYDLPLGASFIEAMHSIGCVLAG
jgi:hypothetical protein